MAPSDGSQLLVDLLGRVKAGWPPGKWEWEGRLSCALTTLDKATEPKGREVLAANLPGQWTKSTLGQAPAPVQQVCNWTGGLKGSQMVFAADLDGVTVYCLWWPWGDGGTFSVRLGAVGPDAAQDLKASVRAAFGI